MQYSILEPSIVWERQYFSFWQSHNWQSILISSGQAKEAFYYGQEDGSILLVEIRSVGARQIAAFSIGVSSGQIKWELLPFLEGLHAILRERWCLFYQIEPLDEIAQGMGERYVYKDFLTPHTRLIDLSLSSEEILAQMHEKGRYNIRLAEKRWVTVRSMEGTEENIDIWMNLLAETTGRDGFSHNSRTYYEVFIREMRTKETGELLFAFYEGEVIAASIMVYTPSRAIYYYGASVTAKDLRKHMAPYLLQWHAIQEAKRRSIPTYDFLWVADPANPDDSLLSVTEFKEKFWGIRLTLPRKIFFTLSWKLRTLRIIRSLSGR